jgi:hypothetical protein
MASMSDCSASVTTSASSPSITALAWAPEPPWLARTVTSLPVAAFQALAKAGLIAAYSSRVGS